MNTAIIKVENSENGTEFMFMCKHLYRLEVHPYDFKYKNSFEYRKLIDLGKELLIERGIQDFCQFLMEPQYRVAVWASMIAMDYGNPPTDEILRISGTTTIVSACLDCIIEDEITMLSDEIKHTKKMWVKEIKIKV